MFVFKLKYAQLCVSDLAHHGYIVSVTDVIKAVRSILYWNTEMPLLGYIERLYPLAILTSLITITFNTAASCLRIFLPRHLNVSVERSTGKVSWNRAHVQKETKKKENYMWQRQE